MQDIHSIGSSGGGAGLFAGEVDRRSRPHHHDLKCPRCESLNTKFCYYNNYNLSQPRHFCKSCRRYWTKGGVLRNVPVGGGIRKTKRSGKPKSRTSNNLPSSEAVAIQRKHSNSENSSSDSSSLTANRKTAPATPMTTTEVSASNSTNSMPALLLNFNESSTRFFTFSQSSTPITTVDPIILNQSSARNMSPEIGTFKSMVTSSTDHLPLEVTSSQMHQQNQLQWTETVVKMPEMRSSMLMDQTAEIDYTGFENRRSNGGLAGKDDWQNSADEGLFDVTGTIDQSYWCQSRWNDDDNDDQHLSYLP